MRAESGARLLDLVSRNVSLSNWDFHPLGVLDQGRYPRLGIAMIKRIIIAIRNDTEITLEAGGKTLF